MVIKVLQYSVLEIGHLKNIELIFCIAVRFLDERKTRFKNLIL